LAEYSDAAARVRGDGTAADPDRDLQKIRAIFIKSGIYEGKKVAGEQVLDLKVSRERRQPEEITVVESEVKAEVPDEGVSVGLAMAEEAEAVSEETEGLENEPRGGHYELRPQPGYYPPRMEKIWVPDSPAKRFPES
jgi:hypothetical protein